MKILFVCLGNICRSPLAEVVFADYVRRQGGGQEIEVDSAGTSGHHQGEQADLRARTCAGRHGLTISHRARALKESDFFEFDFLIAMDQSNATDLLRRAPPRCRRKVRLFREWDPAGPGEIPDPYYGGEGDFEMVWDFCHRCSPGLFQHIARSRHPVDR